MKFRAIRDSGPCAFCGKTMKEGELLRSLLVSEVHERCYQKRRPKTHRLDASKVLMEDLKRRARRLMNR